MSKPTAEKNFSERLADNQTLLGGGGLVLFFLGLISWFMAMAENGVTDGRMNAILSSIILLSMGYPMLLHVGLLKKLNTTEDRIKQLEEMTGTNKPTNPVDLLD